MAEIRSAGQVAEKWQRVTPLRTQDFESGVRNPRRDWEQATGDSEDRYEQGIQEAIQQKRFSGGVRAAGTQKWQRKTQEVGVSRWGPGVQAAQADYERGFAPFRDAIERTSLPPRFPAGDPRNIERVGAIARALHQARVGGGSGV